jgi:hypothetical protein
MPDDVDPQDDSWRSALSDSLDKAEAAEPAGIIADAPPIGATPEPAAAEAVSDGRARDESGRFVKQDAKPAESDKPQHPPPAAKPSPAGQGAAAGATASAAAPAAPPASALRPPQNWKPTARAKWDQLPPEVQEEAVRVHNEVRKVMDEAAEAKKSGGAWGETVRPYEAQIRAAGGSPQQYVGTLLQTAHALSYGHPQQKASIVAGLAMQFGITPQDLDSALVAVMQGRQAPQQQPQQFKDPRVDQLLQTIQQREAAQAEDRASRFAEAPGHEYFEDVSDEMVSLIEFWKGQGKPVTDELMEKAYRIACQNNDDVSKVISQKEAAKSAANAQASTQRAKAAASTIRSTPGGNSAPASPGDDWRAHLEAAAEKAGW